MDLSIERREPRSPADCRNRLALARRGRHPRVRAALAAQPALRDAYIELHGELGAGKTTFVRHLLRALGVDGPHQEPDLCGGRAATPDVRPAGVAGIWHFDFYRFNDPREWEDAGFRDIFASPGLKLVEWPEKAGGAAAGADLGIAIELPDRRRRARARSSARTRARRVAAAGTDAAGAAA